MMISMEVVADEKATAMLADGQVARHPPARVRRVKMKMRSGARLARKAINKCSCSICSSYLVQPASTAICKEKLEENQSSIVYLAKLNQLGAFSSRAQAQEMEQVRWPDNRPQELPSPLREPSESAPLPPQLKNYHIYETRTCHIRQLATTAQLETTLKDNFKCQTSNSTNSTSATTTTTTTNLRAEQRHFWPRWPHGQLSSERLKDMKRKSHRGEDDGHTPLFLSSPLLFVTITSALLLLLTLTTSMRRPTCSGVAAYQLTNNLIANNLPPKFVHATPAPTSTSTSSVNTVSPQSQTSSEIVVRVKEGPASIGKLIYTLKGEDPDDDPLTFGVLGTMASDLLRIENVPGNQANVYLRKELDRETTESHQVVITLTDGKLGRGNWVEDVNDNYPVFGPHRTAISIREDARAPLVIETIEATDADEGRFGQVIYRLDETLGNDQLATAGGGNGKGEAAATTTTTTARLTSISDMFAIETIDGRGVISLIGQLDYEQRPLYQLRILAIDRAHENERLSTSTSILISVEDCEDQPPMFTFAPSITRIPENTPVGAGIVRVSAIDGDRGVNAPIKYAIVSVNGQEVGFERNLFSIGSDSGQITVAHELDRELSLGSTSSGGGGGGKLSSSGSGNQQPGAYVIQVRATELSSSQSSDSLFGGGGSGSPASVSTELTIILIDVNDELPTFDQVEYYGELLENSPAESLVTFVRAPAALQVAASATTTTTTPASNIQQQLVVGAKVVDRDQGTNGTFTLHVEGEHGHLFDVWPSEATNEANLMIKVSSSAFAGAAGNAAASKYLDYEKTKELRITLVAREKYSVPGEDNQGGDDERVSTAQMVIRLRDANDNYPQFDSELYKVEIPENAIRGMHICAVKALDADSGVLGTAGLRYTEIRGERANKFKLDPLTGVITLKTNEHGFDRESVAQHHLIVEARDNLGTGNRNTTQLLIILTDVNDQRPKFALDQYETFIYENELDFQSPLQVQAHDADAASTQNSKITYSIVAGDPQQNFTIDPLTGRIRVRTTLLAASTAAAGSPQVQMDGSTTTQVISGSRAQQQHPSETEGDSTVATGLDFERIAQKRDDTRQFNLTIRAQDSGSPEPLASTTQVIVLVYDKNDHAPVFTRSLYAKALREDAPGGSPVIQVQAHDGDHSPTNSKISYRISSGGSDKFVIDSDSGLISIANGANLDIDRVQGGGQKRTSYLLNVLAFDGSFGQNQKSSSCLVNVSIIDVNNKAPEFVSLGASQVQSSSGAAGGNLGKQQQQQQQQQQQITSQQVNQQQQLQQSVFVNEDAPYGLIVTRVFASDLDSSAELRYSINYARSEARNEDMLLVEPSLYRDVFTIEPTDGTIKVNKQLDRELFDQVKLRLQVEDLAAQTADQVAHTYLLIRIADINDNRPSFKKPVYKAVVNENSISGTSVITMSADDRDLNKTLRYSLEAATPEVARLVRINPRSGEVTVNDKIDRELHPMINVTIKAEDYGLPRSLTGSAQLIITVRDENDNNPIFLNMTHLRPGAGVGASSQVQAREQVTNNSAHLPANHNLNYFSSASANSNSPATASAESPASSYRLRSLGPLPLGGVSTGGIRGGGGGGVFLGEDQPPVLDLTEEQFAHHHQQAAAASASFAIHAQRDTQPPHDENGHELALLAPGSSAHVREDAPIGHQIAYVRAEDADLGNNGRVTYLLDPNSSGGGKFRIDRDSGILSVAQQLDREQQKHYTLIIEACDNFDFGYSTGESRRAFTQVAIQVLDINDNAPLISTSLLHTVSAQQPRFGHHQQAAAAAPAATLASGQSSGQFTSSRPSYDEAMNSPGPYEMPLAECLFIDEFQALNEPILTVSASDPDDPELPNGQIDLAIINNLPQNEMFSLVPIRGGGGGARMTSTSGLSPAVTTLLDGDDLPDGSQPTTNVPPPATTTTTTLGGDQLDRSFGEHPSASVQRHRRKRSPQQTRAAFTDRSVTLSQLVAQPGTFYGGAGSGGRGRSSVPAPSPLSQLVGSHQPRLPGTSPVLVPHQHHALRTLQQVQQIEGGEQQMHVVVSQSLRERVGNYSILVRATDRGTPALSSLKLINICVLDVNNHAPVFTRPSLNNTIRVMENATIGTFVVQVEASDRDRGLNGELQYSLKRPTNTLQSGDWQAFKIDRVSGVITTARLFNRQLKKYYTLRVQAQDLGKPTSLSSDIDINIMIVNSGKYQPEFEQQTQVLAFTENVAPGLEWFTLLQTTNLDDDPALINANIAQPISSTNENANSGTNGTKSPSSSSSSNWLSSPCYYIVDGDDHEQVFQLDRYTHRLSNQRELDREKKVNYTLIVKASNNCSRPPAGAALSSRLLAPPPLPNTSQSGASGNQEVSLTTTLPTTTTATGGPPFGAAGELVAALAATRDSGVAASGRRAKRSTGMAGAADERAIASTASRRAGKRVDFSQSVSSGGGGSSSTSGPRAVSDDATPPPHATETSAALSSTAADLLATKEASALASALDALVASDKSLLKVSIRIKDVNDNAPKFTQKIYTGGITTEADFGTVFMIVQANDADADTNGQVSYSIVKPIKRNLSTLQQHASVASSGGGGGNGDSPTISSGSASTSMSLSSSPLSRRRRKRQAATAASGTGSAREQLLSAAGDGHQNNELAAMTTIPLGGQSAGSSQLSPTLVDGDDLFVINAQTGEISLNFDPQKHMKGYFEFEIQAKDPEGLGDSARVLIYLLRQDQRVKFVLRLTPQELRQRLNKFRSVFGNITGAIVNIDSYKYYENQDGTVDKKKTSLFLHFVQPEDNTIIDVDKVLTLIDNNIEYLDELYKEFHVLSSEAAHLPLSGSGALVDPIDQVRTGLLGISSFLALILVLVIALCLNQRTRYERQLKAATVSAFGSSPLHLDADFHAQTNLPNTNLHSQDPNPIWMVNNAHAAAAAAVAAVGPYGAGGGNSSSANILTSDNAATHNHHRQAAAGAAAGGGATGKKSKRPGSRMRATTAADLYLEEDEDEQLRRAASKRQQQQQHQKLFHSASSGLGMTLDDELNENHHHHHNHHEDDDDDDELSTSGGDLNSSDLNSLSGASQHNQHLGHNQHNHHNHHHRHYNVTSATTATPRDSLVSSHDQVSSPSSSSGSNSASTTNERQVLCMSSADHTKQLKQTVAAGNGGKQQLQQKQQTTTNVKLNSARGNCLDVQTKTGLMGTTGTNSTFGGGGGGGAFKEVTIYTEQPRHQQQQRQTQVNNNNKSRVGYQQQQQQQQQTTSQVSRLASQLNAVKLQPTIQQQQQQQQQQARQSQPSIYVSAQHQQKSMLVNQKQQQQQQQHMIKQPILIHSNGADVNQGIIRTTTTTAPMPNSNATSKQMAAIHSLDAKFVPPPAAAAAAAAQHQNIQQQQDHEQSVKNFETSLSKLSILNLETTEL